MQRSAAFLFAVAAMFVLGGCNDKKKDMQTEPEKDAYTAYNDDSLTYEEPSNSYYAPETASVAPAAQATPAAQPAPAATRTHVVAKGETLNSIARMYYSDQSKWRQIYEANRGTLTDPNRLRIGQELVIP